MDYPCGLNWPSYKIDPKTYTYRPKKPIQTSLGS
jgi:hypothetical protein